MALSKTWNGTTYSIPQSGERGWATLTNFLSALADGAQSTGKQLIGRRVATTTPVTVTATTDAYVGVNVSGSAAAVNLPAGVSGQVFYIADESGAAATYNITITPNGAETIGGGATYVINANSQAIGIVYSGTDWKLFANFTPVAVTPSSSTTFTNKKLTDSSCTFVDEGDATKQFAIQASGITTGTTRTWTVPDSNDTFVGKATTDVLTNKKLTDSSCTFVDEGDATKQFAVQVSGVTTATTRTWTVPDSNDTFVGKATTDVLTNKTLTAPIIPGNVTANDSNVVFTNADNRVQICLPTTARTYTLPTTSILAGDTWQLSNRSAYLITLNSSAGNLVSYIPAYSTLTVYALQNTPTSAAHWSLNQLNPIHIRGIITGTAPAAGYLGEVLSAQLLRASATSLTTATAKTAISLTLTAGRWLLYSNVGLTGSSATMTITRAELSLTDNTLNAPPSGSGTGFDDSSFTIGQTSGSLTLNNADLVGALCPIALNYSSSTTVYLVVSCTFASGTASAYGRLQAVRVA